MISTLRIDIYALRTISTKADISLKFCFLSFNYERLTFAGFVQK